MRRFLYGVTAAACFRAVQSQHYLSSSWGIRCEHQVRDAWNTLAANQTDVQDTWFIGPDRKADPARNLSDAWGITYPRCLTTCGNISYPDAQNFTVHSTTWLLPWLTLVAQLPYETVSPLQDVLSALLAIGSPMLATYSMIMTLIMKKRVRDRFSSLLDRITGAGSSTQERHRKLLVKRIRYAQTLVEESIQTPMRVCDAGGWLANLITLDENHPWWRAVSERLEESTRSITASLVFQVLFAALTWLLTVIAAKQGAGELTSTDAIAISSLWMWLLPIVAGWVSIGTQWPEGTVRRALKRTNVGTKRKLERLPRSGQHPLLEAPQESIVLAAGVTDEERSRTIRRRSVIDSLPTHQPPPQVDVENFHEMTPAPSSPYQDSAVSSTRSASPTPSKPRGQEVYEDDGDNNPQQRTSTSSDTTWPTFLGFDLLGFEGRKGPMHNYARTLTYDAFSHNILTAFSHLSQIPSHSFVLAPSYTPWSQAPPQLYLSMLIALFSGILLQWGTTGPAIVILYNTPPIGVGCRTGASLIYGALASLSCFLLITASLTSHASLLAHQSGRKPSRALALAHIITLNLGCVVAVANAAWLVVSCIMALAGLFDTCWCNSDYASDYGSLGVLLFRSAEEVAPHVESYWSGGIAFGATVVTAAGVLIGLAVRT